MLGAFALGCVVGSAGWYAAEAPDRAMLAEARAAVAGLTAKVSEAEGRIAAQAAAATARDPDALYQAGKPVASTQSGEVDAAGTTARFARATGGPDFSMAADMEFRQYQLSGCQYGSYGTRSSFGVVTQQDFEQVTCHVAGLRR